MANTNVMQTSVSQKVKPFGIKDRIGYMFGDLGNTLLFLIASMYLITYYNDVFGISAGILGTLFFVLKLLDAFTDVFMGRIVDKFKGTKAGKFRPWILWMAGPVALSSFLMYQSYLDGLPMPVKYIYVIVTYILFNSIFYTAINIPYGSMAAAITTDPVQRTSLSAWRGVGPILVSIFAGGLMPLFLTPEKTVIIDGKESIIFPIDGEIMMIVTGCAAALSIVAYLACYFMSTERVKLNQNKQPVSILKSLGNIFKSKAFIIIVIAMLVGVATQMGMMTVMQYLFKFRFGGDKGMANFGYFNMIGSVAGLALITPFAAYFVKLIGKKLLSVITLSAAAVLYLLIFFLNIKDTWTFIIISAVAYLLTAVFNTIIWAFIMDIIDDMQVKTNTREDGAVYSVFSFSRKVGQGFAGFIGGWIVTLSGVPAGHTPIDNKVLVGQNLYNAAALYPFIGYGILALILFFLYPLSKNIVLNNAKILKERREATVNPENGPAPITDATNVLEAVVVENTDIVAINTDAVHNGQNEDNVNDNNNNDNDNDINHLDDDN